ncbi:torsin-1A-like [Hydractinia symbiolongicarpus]|uniref:torsin-1A-like n=1 Tax=Hydractinia symbiolongicarpus TaxID=13093 RepID=UPI00254D938B|nr:torsin-1A-like [Hydractinia symbiolongicarpus]
MKVLMQIIVFYCSCTVCLEPVTAGFAVAGLVAGLSAGYWKGVCHFKECCTKKWTNHNITELYKTFDAELFGQHLVKRPVYKAVLGHLQNDNPKKALVLSFHGWTGSGKNYVADMIAKHVYREGLNSQFVHKKIATLNYPHSADLNKYKDELKNFIQRQTKNCERSLFIFDEMDKMPIGLTDVLKPFLDFHVNIEGQNYRKNIFIFLSNTAGDHINKKTLQHFQSGRAREALSSKEMEQILSIAAFNMDGGLHRSELILAGLVDHFIPFLPMERKHVMLCAEAVIKKRGKRVQKVVLEEVANELHYFPNDLNIYSKTGCKQVEKKVDGFI